MKNGTKVSTAYSITGKNADAVTINAKVTVNGTSITAKILLSNKIIQFCGIDNCKRMLDKFFQIFEGDRMGMLTMDEIISATDFSSIVFDYIDGIMTLSTIWGSGKHFIDFTNEYEFKKWYFGDSIDANEAL